MDSKTDRMREFLLSKVRNNSDGMFIEDLWEEIFRESSFKEDNLTERDMGPVLLGLVKDNLIQGDTWYYKEGPRLVFVPVASNPTWIDRAVCMFTGHRLPMNCAFESQMALFVGGICTRCDKLVQGEFLGNCWTEEVDKGYVIELKGYDLTPAFEKGLRVCRI